MEDDADYYYFVCPACDGRDIFPPSGSDRYTVWYTYSLLTCGDCGHQTVKPKRVGENDGI